MSRYHYKSYVRFCLCRLSHTQGNGPSSCGVSHAPCRAACVLPSLPCSLCYPYACVTVKVLSTYSGALLFCAMLPANVCTMLPLLLLLLLLTFNNT